MTPRLICLALALSLSGAIACRKRSGPAPGDGAVELDGAGFGPGGIELAYAASYIGSAACGKCHTGHFELARTHHMARTGERPTAETIDLWFSTDLLAKPLRWPPSEPSPAPRYRREGAEVLLEVRGEGGSKAAARVAAVFGSRAHGFTPIAVEDGRAIRELRISHSEVQDAWIMTPGSAGDPDPLGHIRSPEMSRNCLSCHTTLLAWGRDRLDLEATVFGIGCERCHGPGSAHVEAVAGQSRELAIYNPGALRADEEVKFCGQCHRQPSDIEPGQVLERAPDLARHAGAGLMLSACFRRSPPAETIRCLDCHDPHRNNDPARDARGAYNQACRRCHARPAEDHPATQVGEGADCISCHLAVESRAFSGMDFTDHWIRVPGRPAPGSSPERSAYEAYLEAGYRDALARRGLGTERKARLRMRLGELLFGRGEREPGLEWMREALELAPLYRDRLVAAELHDRAGKPDEAVRILEEAIRLHPENNYAYHNLARLHLARGRREPAEAVLAAWERARPGDPALVELRDELKRLDPSRGLKSISPRRHGDTE
jgi:tetratricopeptide (TPR) repeat protein